MNIKMKAALRAGFIIFAMLLTVTFITVSVGTPEVWQQVYSFFGFSNEINSTYVKVMDVGQGDSILIHSLGRTALIDFGDTYAAEAISQKLKSGGIKAVDVALLSHLHQDHSGGIIALSEEFEINNLIIPDILKTDEVTAYLKRVEKLVFEEGGEVYTAVQGMNTQIGEFTLTVIAYYSDEIFENDRSIAVIAEAQGVRFLFTGDGSQSFEKHLIDDKLNIKCDVLKVGHHGGGDATSENFLESCTPKFAAISCGEANIYSHPHTQTISRLEKAGATVLRTDISGDITFYVENGKLSVETEK